MGGLVDGWCGGWKFLILRLARERITMLLMPPYVVVLDGGVVVVHFLSERARMNCEEG